jgi:hypothetical protein
MVIGRSGILGAPEVNEYSASFSPPKHQSALCDRGQSLSIASLESLC